MMSRDRNRKNRLKHKLFRVISSILLKDDSSQHAQAQTNYSAVCKGACETLELANHACRRPL